MVGAAGLVQQQVPVDPAHRPAVQVVDDRSRITLAQRPLAGVRAAFLAAFGEQQLLVGPGVVHQLHVVEVVFAVPVEAGAPHVLGGLGVGVDHAGALDHDVPVVVPHHDAHPAQAGRVQFGPQEVAHEVALFFGGVEAGIPALVGLGLVLHRDAPHRHAFGRVGLDEAHEATRPGLAVLGQQAAAVVHLAVALHPGRRAPRRHQQLQGPAGGPLRGADHRQQGLPVALDAEAVQRHVARRRRVRVVAQREVAAVHVHAAQRVAVALAGAEAVAQEGFALRVTQPQPGAGGGLGEGAAEAQVLLEAAAAVHPQPRPAGRRAGPQRRLFGEPGAAVAGAQPPAQGRVRTHSAAALTSSSRCRRC